MKATFKRFIRSLCDFLCQCLSEQHQGSLWQTSRPDKSSTGRLFPLGHDRVSGRVASRGVRGGAPWRTDARVQLRFGLLRRIRHRRASRQPHTGAPPSLFSCFLCILWLLSGAARLFWSSSVRAVRSPWWVHAHKLDGSWRDHGFHGLQGLNWASRDVTKSN